MFSKESAHRLCRKKTSFDVCEGRGALVLSKEALLDVSGKRGTSTSSTAGTAHPVRQEKSVCSKLYKDGTCSTFTKRLDLDVLEGRCTSTVSKRRTSMVSKAPDQRHRLPTPPSAPISRRRQHPHIFSRLPAPASVPVRASSLPAPIPTYAVFARRVVLVSSCSVSSAALSTAQGERGIAEGHPSCPVHHIGMAKLDLLATPTPSAV